MYLTNQVVPTREQYIRFMKEYPAGEPVVMVNLIKFKETVEGGEEAGAAAFARYRQNVLPLLENVGARVLWSGQVNMTVIGDSEDQPDMVLVVEYPSSAKFVEMTTSEAYLAISHDREISLKYGGLLASAHTAF